MRQILKTCLILFCASIALNTLRHAVAQPIQQSDAPTAYDVVKPREHSDVRLSPSGEHLAMLRVKTDRFCLARDGQMRSLEKARCNSKRREYRATYEIVIHNLNTNTPIKVLPLPENFSVDWIEWATEERLLIAIQSASTYGSSAYKKGRSRIISVDVFNSAFTALMHDLEDFRFARSNRWLSKITDFLPQDPDHVLIAARDRNLFNLWKVNLVDGTSEIAEFGKKNTIYWWTDLNGVARIRIDCGGTHCNKLEAFTRRSDSDEWTLSRIWDRKHNEDETDFDFLPIASTANPSEFLVVSQEDESPRHSIKIFNIDQNDYVQTLYEHPEYDVSGALYFSDTRSFAGATYYADTLEVFFADQDLAETYRSLRKEFGPKTNVRIVSASDNNDTLILLVSNKANSGTYFKFDRRTNELNPLTFARPSLRPFHEEFATDVHRITTRDGTEITAYHSYPTSTGASAEIPLLVIPHGGPEARDVLDYADEEFFFLNRGYQVLKMNFRGSAGYGRAFVEAGHGEWGGAMQDDVTDTVEFLFGADKAAPENTCIFGYSYGGYVALYGAATTPNHYKCVVSGGAPTDLALDLKQTRRAYGRESEVFDYWVEWLGDPKTDKALLNSKSPIHLAQNIKAPVLLIHGEYDGIVDISHARKMRSALKRAGVAHEYHILEDAGHSYWSLETNIEYLETIEAFLAKHLTHPESTP